MRSDPAIQGAELEIDYIDGLRDCDECELKALPGDTLCIWCRMQHPRPDSGLENIPFEKERRP